MTIAVGALSMLLVAAVAAGQTVLDVRIDFVSSEETSAAHNNHATSAIDKDTGTIWHTQWVAASPPHPHEIRLDLMAPMLIADLTYTPRQDIANGRIAAWEVSVSLDAKTWPVSVKGSWPNSSAPQVVTFPAGTIARYVRLRSLSAHAGPWTSAAELTVRGTHLPTAIEVQVLQGSGDLATVAPVATLTSALSPTSPLCDRPPTPPTGAESVVNPGWLRFADPYRANRECRAPVPVTPDGTGYRVVGVYSLERSGLDVIRSDRSEVAPEVMVIRPIVIPPPAPAGVRVGK